MHLLVTLEQLEELPKGVSLPCRIGYTVTHTADLARLSIQAALVTGPGKAAKGAKVAKQAQVIHLRLAAFQHLVNMRCASRAPGHHGVSNSRGHWGHFGTLRSTAH